MKGFKMGMAQGAAKQMKGRGLRGRMRGGKRQDPMDRKIAAAYQNAKAEALRNGASEEEATAIGNKAQAEFLAEYRAKERERRKMLVSGPSATQAPQRKSKGGTVKKPEMMYGGMANNKKHMYSAGGSVKDNPGLKALAKQRPDVVAKMMKG